MTNVSGVLGCIAQMISRHAVRTGFAESLGKPHDCLAILAASSERIQAMAVRTGPEHKYTVMAQEEVEKCG